MIRPAALTASLLVLAACFPAAAIAQRFSDPTTPDAPAPAAKPDAPAKPAGDDGANHRVGGGMGFELPLSLYDEKADAARDISRARERAKKDNRRVLVMWGENKCEFCAYLNQLMHTDPRIKQLIETEYDWIKVDIGKFDKNIDLANNQQVPIDKPGFGAPALCVIEPGGGQSIGVVGGNEMVAKPMMPPNNVFDSDFVYNFLDKNKPQPKVANGLLLEARQKAKRDGRRVLTYFNIYGSDACKAFDKLANTPEAAALLEKAFVLRKIDVERNIQGWEMLRKLKGSATASPPWMTVLDGEGVAVSEAGKGLELETDKAGEAADWLIQASGGKLTGGDREAIASAITEAAKPPPVKVEARLKSEVEAAEAGAAEAKK